MARGHAIRAQQCRAGLMMVVVMQARMKQRQAEMAQMPNKRGGGRKKGYRGPKGAVKELEDNTPRPTKKRTGRRTDHRGTMAVKDLEAEMARPPRGRTGRRRTEHREPKGAVKKKKLEAETAEESPPTSSEGPSTLAGRPASHEQRCRADEPMMTTVGVKELGVETTGAWKEGRPACWRRPGRRESRSSRVRPARGGTSAAHPRLGRWCFPVAWCACCSQDQAHRPMA